MNAFALPKASRLHVSADADALAAACAARIAELIAATLAQRAHCRIALAGGETPRRCYAVLRALPVDWGRVQVYFGDERCLPVGDAQRNDTMAQDSLLQHVALPATHLHAIPAELGAEEAAVRYSEWLAQAGTLDLVLLGLGEDGHTASLFPGNPALQRAEPAVAVFDAPKPPPQRISMSLATLNAARHKLFLVAGSGKRDALQRIARGEALPAAGVKDAEWFLDKAAVPVS
ncbi:MAG: 6-phosphogluconolactonase [Sideroxydans sp.]